MTFETWCTCPHCGHTNLHYLRQPNPEPPKRVAEPTTYRIYAWGGGPVREVTESGLDRWDEREFDVVRTCARCQYEWGQKMTNQQKEDL